MLATLLPLLLSAALTVPVPPQQQDGLPVVAELVEPSNWPARCRRDEAITFTQRSIGQARIELERIGLAPARRAVAFMALGCAGAEHTREGAHLSSWAEEGELIERQAAILALGELRLRETALLERIVDEEPEEIAACALLALLRGGTERGARYVDEIARYARHPLSRVATELLLFRTHPPSSPANPTARLLLDLRWEAARRFGLVVGHGWSTLLMRDLLADQEFLDQVLYRAAADLTLPGVRDHYLEVLLSEKSLARIAGALKVMPGEVDSLFSSALWVPANPDEWTALVEEIDALGVERQTTWILRQARYVPHLRLYASILLVRAGREEGIPLLEVDASSQNPHERAAVAGAMGTTRYGDFGEILVEMWEEDADPKVRMSALVALIERGYVNKASTQALKVLDEPENPERACLIDVLCERYQHPRVSGLLQTAYSRAEGEEKERLGIALLLLGRVGEKGAIREAFLAGRIPEERRLEVLQALLNNADAQDLELVRELFPSEEDRELNVELALALIRNQEPVILPILREILWQSPWNRSVLAGGLLVEIRGISALHQELQRPPLGAGVKDFRRVGFALGEWGGLEEVDVLAQRTRSTDPALQGALLGALSARTH